MALIKVYRIQHAISGNGMYTTYASTFDGEIRKNIWKVKNFLEHHFDDNQPCPNDDYIQTFKSCPFDDRADKSTNKPHEKFFNFKHNDSTRYGCGSMHQLFNQWLVGDLDIIQNLELGLYQLLEVYIDEEDCFIMKNQIMFNSFRVLAVEILDIRESFYSVVEAYKNVA